MEEEQQPKPTWYSLHKEQVRLIQFLLYHLKKNKEQKKASPIRIFRQTDEGKQEAEFLVMFE